MTSIWRLARSAVQKVTCEDQCDLRGNLSKMQYTGPQQQCLWWI